MTRSPHSFLNGPLWAIALLSNASSALADVRLPALFTDHMVLQHGQKVPVWGWADPGEQVTVTFLDQSESTTTAADGRWRMDLYPLQPDFTARTLAVQGRNRIEIQDVLVGDVWLCSGQSNMEFGMQRAHNAKEELPQSNHPGIRLFAVPRTASAVPMGDVATAPDTHAMLSKWQVCSPDALANNGVWGGFSAVAYFFAKELQKTTKRPIGLIGSYWGATPAQVWMSLDALRKDPPFPVYVERATHPAMSLPWTQIIQDERLKKWTIWKQTPAALELESKWNAEVATAKASGAKPPPIPQELKKPESPNFSAAATFVYNGMIAPLVPFALQGVIWYQGEANEGMPKEYATLFPRLIEDWRTKWGQGDFPFLFVQLAAFKGSTGGRWARLREAQRLTAQRVPGTGMAVALDLGSTEEIHPTNKEEVGRRLALVARRVAFGEEVVASGPEFSRLEASGKSLRVRFAHAESGLRTGPVRFPKPGEKPQVEPVVLGFEIAGADGKWASAETVLDGDSVVLKSAQITAPTSARYGWANDPACNLFNGDGLPAVPFTSVPLE